MPRTIAAAALVAAALLPFASTASAQSASHEETRTTTTTTREGDTTTTITRTTTMGGEISIDADRLGDGLIGTLDDRTDSRRAPRLRTEPTRPEDVFGDWLADDGGRDVGDCRYNFRDRAFMGVRGLGAEGCPSRLSRASNWRVENGEVLVYRGAGDAQPLRLALAEGRLIGDGLTLRRPGDDGPGPVADDRDDREGGWSARPAAEAWTGTWRHVETGITGQRRECVLRLTANPAFGGMEGSASGCFGDLMFVNSWRLEDGRVAAGSADGRSVSAAIGRGQPRGGPVRWGGRFGRKREGGS